MKKMLLHLIPLWFSLVNACFGLDQIWKPIAFLVSCFWSAGTLGYSSLTLHGKQLKMLDVIFLKCENIQEPNDIWNYSQKTLRKQPEG